MVGGHARGLPVVRETLVGTAGSAFVFYAYRFTPLAPQETATPA